MNERPPKFELESFASGVDAFEALVNKEEWNAETETVLEALLEKYEEDLYMLYLNYKESGIVDSLPDHERQMYDWLAKQFEE